jgi:hypothetical protein
MINTPTPALPADSDQAAGLRRLFAGRTAQRFMAWVANPHIKHAAVVLERTSSCFALAGVPVLLVDAGPEAERFAEVALLDLGACIERLDDCTGYLAARGLPRACVNSRGSASRLLPALAAAAPLAEVVLVHGEAADLARLFHGSTVRPMLVADDQEESIKHAYAAAKLLSTRAGLNTFDLLLCAPPHSPRAPAIVRNLSSALDTYTAAVLQHWTMLDPGARVAEPPSAGLRTLLARQLRPAQVPATDAVVQAVRTRAGPAGAALPHSPKPPSRAAAWAPSTL